MPAATMAVHIDLDIATRLLHKRECAVSDILSALPIPFLGQGL